MSGEDKQGFLEGGVIDVGLIGFMTQRLSWILLDLLIARFLRGCTPTVGGFLHPIPPPSASLGIP